MNTIQITIPASVEQQEILIGLLSEFEPQGFEQTDETLIAYFSELNFDSYEVNAVIKNFAVETTIIPEENWNALWESNFEPVVVEDFCGVRAAFHAPFSSLPYEIVITPKMSFGTGHHATTYMMVAQMKDLPINGAKVFDFGTGTGILAILAEKMGASRIDAIDNDEWSIRNAKENAANNECTLMNIWQSEILPEEWYDVVLANINRNVILVNMPRLRSMMATKGNLLLSGLMLEDEPAIVEEANVVGLQLVKRMERANWISLLFVIGK